MRKLAGEERLVEESVDRKVVAPKHNFDKVVPFAHSSDESVHISPSTAGEPIPVELVRGANGGDEWEVLVDGVRCPLTISNQIPDELRWRCKLPAGVAHTTYLSNEAAVRPLAIAVRLEAEAMAPLEVRLRTEQVFRTREEKETNITTELSMDKEGKVTQSGSTILLEPYRIGQTTAKAVSMPYPYRAPARGALGILSFDELRAKKEKSSLSLLWNTFANLTNGVRKAVFASQMVLFERNQFLQDAAKAADYAISAGARTQLGGNKPKRDELPPAFLGKRPPRPDLIKKIPTLPAKSSSTANVGSFVIGGKNKTVMRELIDLFDVMIDICNGLSEKASEKPLTQRLNIMRCLLKFTPDPRTSVLFDALFLATPIPSTLLFLESLPRVPLPPSHCPSLGKLDARLSLGRPQTYKPIKA